MDVHDAGLEVEVLLGEPDGFALTEPGPEPDVDRQVIPLLEAGSYGVDGRAAPRFGLLPSTPRSLHRLELFARALEDALVVDGRVEDGREVNPDHLGRGGFDPREELPLESPERRGVDVTQRERAEERNDVIPDPAAHRGGRGRLVGTAGPPVLFDVVSEEDRTVAWVDELTALGVRLGGCEPLLRVLGRRERAVLDPRDTFDTVARPFPVLGCALALAGLLVRPLLEPSVFYVARQRSRCSPVGTRGRSAGRSV
ncbi:hypothetical protein [Streptomyces oceani]|uniref:hypothetical protein n=1 Tax=Streptomyces oceani TaxID=1075402 RepID=UPI00147A4B41|nr:hypothetical protein [Streptomyces oceani]